MILTLTLAAMAWTSRTLDASIVASAYEAWFRKDYERAEAISGNPGVPMYPRRFSKARCKKAEDFNLDCSFRLKLPLDGGWESKRGKFLKQPDGRWVLTDLN